MPTRQCDESTMALIEARCWLVHLIDEWSSYLLAYRYPLTRSEQKCSVEWFMHVEETKVPSTELGFLIDEWSSYLFAYSTRLRCLSKSVLSNDLCILRKSKFPALYREFFPFSPRCPVPLIVPVSGTEQEKRTETGIFRYGEIRTNTGHNQKNPKYWHSAAEVRNENPNLPPCQTCWAM